MPWFKVDDNLAFHAKVVAAGNPAIGLWARAGSWCAQQLTDGFVPRHMLSSLGTKGQADRLVLVRLWNEVPGGYAFHEWDERQPSRVDIEADRAAAKERMRTAREAKKLASQGVKPQVKESGSQDVRPNTSRSSGEVREKFGNPDPTRPDPTRPYVSTDVDTRPRAAELVKAERPEVTQLCDHLAQRIEGNGAKKPTIGKTWLDAARLMLDNDDRPEHEIHAAIDWCQNDGFWRANILSMPKLREKFDTIRLQAQRNTATTTSSKQAETDHLFDAAMQRAVERERNSA